MPRVHVRLVLQHPLVDHFVLLLLSLQPLLVPAVVLELLNDGVACVLSAYQLILDLDGADLALVDELLVLVVADLPLRTGLELLVAHFLNHGRVCV